MKTLFKLIAACALLNASLSSYAQGEYPSKPITILVGNAAGNFIDNVSRKFAQLLSTEFGQSIVVENRAGSASLIAYRMGARAQPDGYTLLAVTDGLALNLSTYKNPGYRLSDFAPIGMSLRSSFVIITSDSSPFKTINDVVAAARKNPGTISYASSGLGSAVQLAAEIFSSDTKIKLVHVPYKGLAPAIPDVMAGRVSIVFNPIAVTMPLVKGGTMRALAVTSDKRSPLLPDVPTLKELGLATSEAIFFAGLVAPAGTPQAVLDRIHSALNKVKSNPAVRAQIEATGEEVGRVESQAAFGEFLRLEAAKYEKLVPSVGIQPE